MCILTSITRWQFQCFERLIVRRRDGLCNPTRNTKLVLSVQFRARANNRVMTLGIFLLALRPITRRSR